MLEADGAVCVFISNNIILVTVTNTVTVYDTEPQSQNEYV